MYDKFSSLVCLALFDFFYYEFLHLSILFSFIIARIEPSDDWDIPVFGFMFSVSKKIQRKDG